jgi:centractin
MFYFCFILRFLYANIVLTGGNTMFRGFGDRFQAELKELVPKTIKVKVTAERNRKYASWVGGTMYAGLNDYKMILKRDYDEVGSRLITKIFP